MPIHPTAIVDSSAEVSPTADIGPYAIVEAGCHIGADAEIHAHAFIAAGTTLGPRVAVHPFAVVGHHPQDYAWDRSPSYTTIGAGTIIREHAQIHRGTEAETTTVVGENVFVMAMAHIGHNCQVGDNVILTTGALLGGRITVGPRAILGGKAAAHQFCRIGQLAMVAGGTAVRKDIPPFMLVSNRGTIGINAVGLRRNGSDAAERLELKRCCHLLCRSTGPLAERIERIAATATTPRGRALADWLRQPSKRGIETLRRAGGGADE